MRRYGVSLYGATESMRESRASVNTLEESNDESVSYRFAMPVYS